MTTQLFESSPLPISVVVCTYNRAALLRGCLQSLVDQTLDKSLYEVIVVDNNSTDNTRAMTEDLARRHPNVRYSLEAQQGLGHARNRGWREARGEYVAYLDDDARADKDWLEVVLGCFAAVIPTPSSVGGLILPFYDSPKPAWFKDEYEIRTWGDKPRFLKRGEAFSGSNMAFRKEVVEACGGFDTRVGMKGNYLSVGEENSLFENFWQSYGDAAVLYYSPQLRVFHAVPEPKMTLSYHLRIALAYGQAWHLQHGPESLRGRLQLFLKTLVSIARLSGLALAHVREYPTYQNWLIERFAPVASAIGHLARCLGLVISVKQR